MIISQIVPIFLRTAATGDILIATLGNFAVLRPPKVLAEVNINLPPLVNSSDLSVDGHARIYLHEGVLDNIVLPALSNSSILDNISSPFAALVSVDEAPADGFIRLPSLTNTSALSGGSPLEALVSVDAAPPTGFIRLPSLTNSSVLSGGSPVEALVTVAENSFVPADADEENDEMLADGMIGGRMI